MLYHQAAQSYTWGDLLPLPAGAKTPPPNGYTGEHGKTVGPEDAAQWANLDGNVALRLPQGVLGLDVDQYGDKRGLETLAAMEAQLGPLPPTFMSTSRDPSTGSGIRFYRYSGAKTAGVLGEAVEVIQHGHRYAVVWPSVVADRAYQWWKFLPAMNVWQKATRVPTLEDLPELPQAWTEYLTTRAAASAGVASSVQERDQLLVALVVDPRPSCGTLERVALSGVEKMAQAGDGGRHDAMTGAVLALVMAAAEGHPGFPGALETLEAAWDEAIAGDPARAGEFSRMVTTASAKAATKYPPALRPGMSHLCDATPAPVPTPDVPVGAEVTGPPLLPGLPDVFDPPVLHEARLAQAALAVSCTVHRYATDEQSWYSRDDQRGRWIRQPASAVGWSRHILHSLAQRAPEGDKNADKGTPAQIQAERWAALHASARRGSVAQLMVDAAPASGILASDMDADRRTLWAGGWCWDLKASAHRLTLAQVDLLTPHQHSAAVLPRQVPTPRWDAFLEALFPEDEDRQYLLGVLGAATTGVSDRILGVVHGKKGRGKTSILELVSMVLGTYATTLDPDLLDAHKSSEFKVMSLKGIRLGWIDEGPSNNRQGQERLKALTGGAPLRGAHKNRDAVTFPATHTLFFTDNRDPEVADPALRDRVRSLEVDGDPDAVARTVGAIKRDVDEWLATEGPGVLAQLISYAGRYLNDRSVAAVPPHVQSKLEALGREQDPILSWLDERTVPEGETPVTELYADFRAHAESGGTARSLIPSMTAWGRFLNDLAILPRKTMGVRYRPLSIRRQGFGMAWNGLPVPAAGVAQTLPETLPNPPWTLPTKSEPSLNPASGGPATGAEGALGPETLPTLPEPSLYETPSKQNIREGREGREGFLSTEEVVKKDRKNPEGAYTRANPPYPPYPHGPVAEADQADAPKPKATRKPAAPKAPKPDPLAAMLAEGIELPAVLVRGHLQPSPVDFTDAAALLATLAGHPLGLDVETTGFPVGHYAYALKTIQLGTRDWCVVLDAKDAAHLDLAVRVLDQAAEIEAHSATADVSLVALEAKVDSGPWWDKTVDTAVLAALADPHVTNFHNRPKDALKLKVLAAHLVADPVAPAADKARAALFRRGKWLTDVEPTMDHERSGWRNVPVNHPDMVTYAASDVLDTAEIRRLLPEPAPQVMARERATQRVMARLPERGLRLDHDRALELANDHRAHRDTARAKLAGMGLEDPASNAKVGQALMALGAQLPATRTGKPSTAADVVDLLAEEPGPAQDLALALLEYREHDKLLSTYLDPALVQCERGDGRSRPTILTLGAAATGRMSSARPNIQNVPRPTKAQTKPGGGGGLRGVHVSDPGYVFLGADFSSVEVRIAAAVTGDETLAAMVREGIDLHGEITKLAWGLTEDHPTFQDVRYLAKRAVFLNLYGGGLTAMGKTLGPHAHKAQDVVDALRALTPGLVAWDKGLRDGVKAGSIRTWTHPSGRVAYFNQDLPHKALNMVVQGYGRELLVDAVLAWEAIHPGFTVIPIHDELVVQVPEDKAEAWGADLQAVMTTTVGQGACQVDIVSELDPPTHRWGTVE